MLLDGWQYKHIIAGLLLTTYYRPAPDYRLSRTYPHLLSPTSAEKVGRTTLFTERNVIEMNYDPER